ncbi:hypothetical protein [Streptomyces sp. NPDC008121]|uniref:hypothetical protein n=1 Tax=Streptomyces sp. NPDC008121 TaxID=3364809 RepID=UPI0036E0D490
MGALSAGLIAGIAGAASAASQPSARPAVTTASGQEDDSVHAQVYNTVEVTNETGKDLKVASIKIVGGAPNIPVFKDFLWVPVTGDVLAAGEKKTYGVSYNNKDYLNPEVTLEFKDNEGNSARYTTETWFDGGSTLTKDDSTYYKVHGGNAAPGQWTHPTIKNP